jgi:hypothetical protein
MLEVYLKIFHIVSTFYLIYHHNQTNFLFFKQAIVQIISDSVIGIIFVENYWIQTSK